MCCDRQLFFVVKGLIVFVFFCSLTFDLVRSLCRNKLNFCFRLLYLSLPCSIANGLAFSTPFYGPVFSSRAFSVAPAGPRLTTFIRSVAMQRIQPMKTHCPLTRLSLANSDQQSVLTADNCTADAKQTFVCIPDDRRRTCFIPVLFLCLARVSTNRVC